jgi:hypothetical protein
MSSEREQVFSDTKLTDSADRNRLEEDIVSYISMPDQLSLAMATTSNLVTP